MTTYVYTPQATETQARLPAPPTPDLLSPERFDSLAKLWRTRGCWVSLWTAEGRLQRQDREAGPFWAQLARPDGAFLKSLGAGVANTLADRSENVAAKLIVLQPWGKAIAFCLLPFRVGSRVVGAAVASFLTESPFEESFLRLLDACGLDRQAMETMAATLPRHSVVGASDIQELFKLTFRLARDVDAARHEIESLSTILETTYEELHLVYTISGKLSLKGPLSEVLEQVAVEVQAASRACAVAFVLRPDDSSGDDDPVEAGGGRLSDRCVQAGEGAPSLESLVQLAEGLALPVENPPPHVLLNQPGHVGKWRWTSDWLRHLVAIPLCHKGRLAGVMLAINCRDAGDFTSVDVQLFRAVGDRVALHLENHRLYGDLNDLLMGMLHALVRSIDAKDTYTCGHSERVAYYGRRLARQAGLPAATCERIYLAGLLHDVGKIGIPDAILRKKGKLTPEEFDNMKRHPEIGVKILARVRQIQDLLPGVMHHHERYDGGGYPDGVSEERIPLFGRILCIADCFDAMTTHRTYRPALSIARAIDELRRCAGTQFDPRLVDAFVGMDAADLYRAAHALADTEDDMQYHLEPTQAAPAPARGGRMEGST